MGGVGMWLGSPGTHATLMEGKVKEAEEELAQFKAAAEQALFEVHTERHLLSLEVAHFQEKVAGACCPLPTRAPLPPPSTHARPHTQHTRAWRACARAADSHANCRHLPPTPLAAADGDREHALSQQAAALEEERAQLVDERDDLMQRILFLERQLAKLREERNKPVRHGL